MLHSGMPSRASKPPHSEKPPKRPRDINQLAYAIVAEATGTAPPPKPEKPKNPAAVALGKLGAAKGAAAATLDWISLVKTAIAASSLKKT